MKKLIYLLFLGVFLTGCAAPYYVKKGINFDQRILQAKTIGLLDPIDSESNKDDFDSFELQMAIVEKLNDSGLFKVKLISERNYGEIWNSDFQRISRDAREILKEIELEGIWRDKKNTVISRHFPEETKLFKELDPELDLLLVVKLKQHYGNPWAAGLYGFGLVGGLIAGVTAEKDPVIGQQITGHDNLYSSAILVDLDTAEALWYNFVMQLDVNVEKGKHAKLIADYILHGLIEQEK